MTTTMMMMMSTFGSTMLLGHGTAADEAEVAVEIEADRPPSPLPGEHRPKLLELNVDRRM
jgi:hypothetical protein